MGHDITYRVGHPVSVGQYTELLNASTLGERRPVSEPERIAAMLWHANLLVTAWDGEALVGASRCFSDFAYSTYCADLCVHQAYQNRGIGKRLLQETVKAGGCKVVLLAAPKAVGYYSKVGMEQHPSAWVSGPKGI
jgi:GNAT superfamily N-acetyltransferase